jgi:hypothetical protein
MNRMTWSLHNLLHSLELIVKPSKSNTCLRLLALFFVLTVILIFSTSVSLVIKLLLCTCLVVQYKPYIKNYQPHPDIEEIKHERQMWVITSRNGQIKYYSEVTILIQNPLFLILQLTSFDKKRFLILFNDQLATHQLRLLHLKTLKF